MVDSVVSVNISASINARLPGGIQFIDEVSSPIVFIEQVAGRNMFEHLCRGAPGKSLVVRFATPLNYYIA
jgi:hypothetical protein